MGPVTPSKLSSGAADPLCPLQSETQETHPQGCLGTGGHGREECSWEQAGTYGLGGKGLHFSHCNEGGPLREAKIFEETWMK